MRRLMRALRGLSYLSTDAWQAECVGCAHLWQCDQPPVRCPKCGADLLTVEYLDA